MSSITYCAKAWLALKKELKRRHWSWCITRGMPRRTKWKGLRGTSLFQMLRKLMQVVFLQRDIKNGVRKCGFLFGDTSIACMIPLRVYKGL